MSDVVELMVTLRRALLARRPECDVDRPGALDALTRDAEAAFATGEAERVLPGRAAVLLYRRQGGLLADAQRARIEIAPGDPEAMRWCGEQLVALAARYEPTLELTLDAAHRPLLAYAERAGLTPRMTLLHGAPQRAIDGLRARGLSRDGLAGLRIAPLAEEHIEPSVQLLRAIFAERPELGMLSPAIALTPEVQRRLDAFSRSNLARCAPGDALVVLRGEDVVGQAAIHIRDEPWIGRVAGLAIALRPEQRNRGIGKLLYERLIERMLARGVVWMRGRTANPQVLRLGARMGRTVRGWQLEPKSGAASVKTS